MNIFICSIGIVCTLLWSFVSKMTFGLPKAWCTWIDRITFHTMSEEVMQMANGFYYDVRNNDMPTVMFLIVFAFIFGLVFWAMVKIERTQNTNAKTLWIILGFAVLFRLILLPSIPIHENDIYRYLWDGKSANHGINPFKYAPADLFMYEEGYSYDYWDDYWEVTIKGKNFTEQDNKRLDLLLELRDANRVYYDRIGHWQVPTIYPPVAQAVFWLSALLKQDSLVFMKGVFVVFDLGVLLLIVALLKHLNKNPAMCIVYAWSPLVLKEFPNSGHYDSVAIFFTLLFLYLFVLKKQVASTIALAAATLSKFFSGVLLPVTWRFWKWYHVILFGGILVLSYIPYFLWSQTGFDGVFQGLNTYNDEWSYNSSIFAIVYILMDWISPKLTESYFPVKLTVGLMYLGILAVLSWDKRKDDESMIKKSFWALACLFIINPVGDPWYFCWIVPFLCFFPYRSWILLSGLLILSYLNFQKGFAFIGPRFLNIPIMSWIIYIPFFLTLLIETKFNRKRNI